MTASLATSLDALSCWKRAVEPRLASFSAFLDEHALSDAASRELADSLRQRLTSDELKVVFVAESPRSTLELINAILFAETGRRVLPAVTGRASACPVELRCDASERPALSMLPIESRRDGKTVAQLRADVRAWTCVRLQGSSPSQLAGALAEVMRTKRVSQCEAQALGFWDETHPENNPPRDEQGQVEIPAWRYALVNYPHPLFQSGLVVLSAPGPNSLGAEPELALDVLPNADTIVFVLAADTGVTPSDMAIWRDHLAARVLSCVVALDEIDTLRDTQLAPEREMSRIKSLRQSTAQALMLPQDRVFALSASEALIARVEGDVLALQRSRVPELEGALGAQLLRQCTVQGTAISEGTQQLRASATRCAGEQCEKLDEQLLELRGLRSKSGDKVQSMLQRLDLEETEFDQCSARLQALRSVHSRMVKETLHGLASERLRKEVASMQRACASLLHLGAKTVFAAMCTHLRELLGTAQLRAEETHAMLDASFAGLNVDFGFSLALRREPRLTRYVGELNLLEHNYVQYLGVKQILRLARPKFKDEFCHMLISRLVVVFEAAKTDLLSWNTAVSEQVELQLRERKSGFTRRREALERAQSVAGELERRIGEIEEQRARLQEVMLRAGELADGLLQQANVQPTVERAVEVCVMRDCELPEPRPAEIDEACERAAA